MRKWVLIGVLVVVVLPILGFGIWTWAALKFSYSNGQRTGYVQKISHKGWVCKTWEGELTMVTQPGVPPQIFTFTVRDDSIADRILKVAGQRVSLSYEQHPGLPSKCFGETEYFITQVQPAPGP
jgi:hypothetical protein